MGWPVLASMHWDTHFSPRNQTHQMYFPHVGNHRFCSTPILNLLFNPVNRQQCSRYFCKACFSSLITPLITSLILSRASHSISEVTLWESNAKAEPFVYCSCWNLSTSTHLPWSASIYGHRPSFGTMTMNLDLLKYIYLNG